MSKRKEAKPKVIQLVGAGLLCVVIAFTAAVVVYFHRFDRTLLEENRAHLSEVADHIAAYTLSIVHDTQTSLEIAAEALLVISDRSTQESYLKAVAEKQGFAYIGYAGHDGILYATEPSASGDISQEEYYLSAIHGEAVITGLKRHILMDKAISGVILATPIHTTEDGALIAMLDIAQLQKALSVKSFGGEGYSYIIDKQGELVLRTKSMDFNNFYKILKNVHFEKGYSLNTMLEDISSGRAGLTLYNNLGTKQYAYYRPLGMNDWTVVNIVAKDAITLKTANLTKELAFLGTASVFVFLLLLVLAAVMFSLSESRRRATEAKSAFLANMSHEIRTPLNAIVGISEIMLRGGLTRQQRDYVLSIINSGKGLLTIVNDILDISKIEAGKFAILEEEYEVESLLYDVTTIIAVRIGDKPVALLLDIDDSIPAHMIGDMTRVKQILINILGNASKFTKEGYIKLKIRAREEEDSLLITMQVIDTGIGIHKKDLDLLFESFNQVDTHHSHTEEGTGLGLAISKRLCEMMGGTIGVESEYGKGSVFTMTVRQKKADLLPLLQMDWPKESGVLLYEPNVFLRSFYANCMEQMQVPFRDFGDAKEFEDALEDKEYQYALADRLMIRKLIKREEYHAMTFITLLDLEEHPLMSVGSTELTVYAPLFSLQLASILRHDISGQPVIKRAGIDVSMIHPMPYVHILIVDDNEVNLQVAAGLMSPYDMQMDCVFSGREAIKAIQENDYDLVLMDHMMPDLDGVETVRMIRNLPGEKFKKLPIIALTANATADAQALFLSEGFQGFLAKPIETYKLNGVLTKWLRELNDTRAAQFPQEHARVVESGISKESLDFLQAFQASHEVDFRNGVSQLQGLKPYVNVLNTYCKTTKRLLSEMTLWLNEDFERFIIEIHGLKGASAAISAFGVSELAQHIEQLGKQHDSSGIEMLLPQFLERVKKSLIEAEMFINAYQEEYYTTVSKSKQPESTLTEDLLRTMEQAFLDYDTEKLEELFEMVSGKNFGEAANQLLKKLRGFYETYEFEEPLKLLASYKSGDGKQDTR